jgi:hypothetical protein
LTDSALWLLYIIGAVIALALVLRRRWRIVPSTFAGMIPTLLGWLVIYFTMAEEDRPKWWRLDLSLNLSFALIFAACGAAAAMALQYRSSRGEDRLTNED